MKVRNEDSTHFKAIDLVITVDPHDGFNAAAGTHYVTIEVAAPGRLGVATSTCATDSAKYVSDNIKIYIPFTVGANGTFTTVTKYAALSITGTTGEQNSLTLESASWTVACVDSEPTATHSAALAASLNLH